MGRPGDHLLTLSEAAAELRVSRETVRKLTASGRLPFVPVGTGSARLCRRVRRETLERFKRQERRDAFEELIERAKLSGKAGLRSYV
jgi:excisionase family DNA binding protein